MADTPLATHEALLKGHHHITDREVRLSLILFLPGDKGAEVDILPLIPNHVERPLHISVALAGISVLVGTSGGLLRKSFGQIGLKSAGSELT